LEVRLFVFRDDYANSIEDLAVQARVKIESASYISKEDRRRLIKDLAEIKVSLAEPSHK
jgi:hypothetical protein